MICGSLPAQKKQLSDTEMWDNSVQITDPAMQVTAWTKDKVVLTSSSTAMFAADLRTGKISPYKSNTLNKEVDFTVNIKDDNVYLKRNNNEEQLTNTPEKEKNPVLSPDNKYAAFTRNNDLYTIRLADKKETRLTTDGSDVILNGYASWVYMEEVLGRESHYRAFWWSPDSKYLAFFRTDDSQVPVFTITDSPGQGGYVETLRYPKAGENIPQVKTGIVKPDGGAVVWAAVPDGDNHYFGYPCWRPDGNALWLQWFNYGQDTLKFLETDLNTGVSHEIYSETQSTWIEPRGVRFLKSGKGFLMASDKSGWNQLYLHDMNGNLHNRVTSGSFTVNDIIYVDEIENVVYFTCNKDQLAAVDFYRVGLDGENLQRLSFGNYTHQINMSPDGKYFVTTYSNAQTPPRVALYANNGKFIRELQNTKNKNFDHYEKPETEYITVRSDDGLFELPLRIIMPLQMEAGKKYPVTISVYGGPNTRSVYEGWENTFGGETHRLAQDGLIQAVIDHRGSGHNGKVGQNYMHRNFGYWEIKDYAQIVRWLVENKQADPEKIMLTGFSYGGYITCYALAYGAEVFTHGIAGGSVTDWTLYDAIYTERFMDTPAENPEGYKSASVLTHAGNLKGKLLLTHGLRDENVHAQNTFQLVSAFEDLHKDFELMIYPESRHGYRGEKRKHSYNSDLRFIYENLLEKPVPKEMIK